MTTAPSSTAFPTSARHGKSAGVSTPRRRRRSGGVIRRNQRVERYRELVRPLAIHYARRCGEPSEDLVQVGLMGLIRAAELYDGSRATRFESFARPHIRGAILHYLRDSAPSVRLPRRQAELQEKLIRLGNALEAAAPASRQKAEGDLRRSLGVGEQEWHLLQRQRRLNRPCRLEASLLEERMPARRLAEGDDPGADTDRDRLDSPCSVEAMLACLPPREREVVRQVVLAGWSYRKLAAELGISPMTVQRLLKRGLELLKRELEGGALSSGDRAGRAPSAVPAC
jgi:RNA polymerase sigma-B factor